MKFQKQILTAAIFGAFAFSGATFAADSIDAKYDAAKKECDSLSGNAKDICMAQAKGDKNVAKAEVEAAKKDTVKNRYEVNIAKADAAYDVAKEKCDDLAGNAKDVCVKDAKAAHTAAQADAKADKKVTTAVHDDNKKVAEARKDAAEDKRDANYAAAKERCDSYSGDAKDKCVAAAKAQNGK